MGLHHHQRRSPWFHHAGSLCWLDNYAFKSYDYGYGIRLAWIMFIIVCILTICHSPARRSGSTTSDESKVTSMGMKASNKIATFFKYFVLILVGVIMIYPLLWMISATFKDNSEIFAGISPWIKHPTLMATGGALEQLRRFHQHPAGHAEHSTATSVRGDLHGGLRLCGCLRLGRFDFPGRKLMFNIMLATLFLPQVN